MRAVLQRVSRARVSAEGEIRGEIGRGLLVLLGVCADDEPRDAEILAAKTANMRIFEDEEGKMNLSCLDLAYEVLVISQFTLCADIKKGNRPSFIEAARPDKAVPLYELYMEKLREKGIGKVEKGLFGAHMDVELLNDGPVTIVCDSRLWKGSGR